LLAAFGVCVPLSAAVSALHGRAADETRTFNDMLAMLSSNSERAAVKEAS
jgi:hypothetical protein